MTITWRDDMRPKQFVVPLKGQAHASLLLDVAVTSQVKNHIVDTFYSDYHMLQKCIICTGCSFRLSTFQPEVQCLEMRSCGLHTAWTQHIRYMNVITSLLLRSELNNTCSHCSRKVPCLSHYLFYCEGFANSLLKLFNAAQRLATADSKHQAFLIGMSQKLHWQNNI